MLVGVSFGASHAFRWPIKDAKNISRPGGCPETADCPPYHIGWSQNHGRCQNYYSNGRQADKTMARLNMTAYLCSIQSGSSHWPVVLCTQAMWPHYNVGKLWGGVDSSIQCTYIEPTSTNQIAVARAKIFVIKGPPKKQDVRNWRLLKMEIDSS